MLITLDLAALDPMTPDADSYTLGLVVGLLRGAGITVLGFVAEPSPAPVDPERLRLLDRISAEQVPEVDRNARPYDVPSALDVIGEATEAAIIRDVFPDVVDAPRPRIDHDAIRARATEGL